MKTNRLRTFSLLTVFLLPIFSEGQNLEIKPRNNPDDTLLVSGMIREAVEVGETANFQEAFRILEQAREILVRYSHQPSFAMAEVLYQTGATWLSSGDKNAARPFLRKALDLYRITAGEYSDQTANALDALGAGYLQTSRQDSALICFQSALAIRKKTALTDSSQLFGSFLNIGNYYFYSNRPDSAIFNYRKCLDLADKNPDNPRIKADNAHHNLGIIYSARSDRAGAEYHLTKALELRLDQGNFYPAIGTYTELCYLETEPDCEKAILLGAKGAELAEKIKAGNSLHAAYLHHALGNAFQHKTDYDSALVHLERSLDLLTRLKGPDDPDLAPVLISLSLVEASGPEHTQRYLLKAIDICRRHNLGCSEAYNNLARSYAQTGNFKDAIPFAEKAMRGFLTDFSEKREYKIGVAFENLGNLQRSAGQPGKALRSYNSALEALQQFPGNAAANIASVYIAKAALQIDQKAYSDAEALLERAESMLQPGESADLRVLFALNLNRALLKAATGNLNQAVQCTDIAIRAAGNHPGKFNFNMTGELIDGNVLNGNLYRLLYQRTGEISALEKSAGYFDNARKTIAWVDKTTLRESDRFRLAEALRIISEGRINTAAALAESTPRETAALFRISEDAKTNILRSAIREADVKTALKIPREALNAERQLKVDISFLQKKLDRLSAENTPADAPEALGMQRQLFALERALDSLQTTFRDLDNRYLDLKYASSTETVESVQQDLIKPGQALLEYFVGDSTIFIFVITPDRYSVKQVKKDFPLEEWVASFRNGIYGYHSLPDPEKTTLAEQKTQKAFIDYGQKLYAALFAPVAEWLPESVIVIPDGVLGYIPFAALISGPPTDPDDYLSYPFLVRRFQFSYCYSAGLLREMVRHKHAEQPEMDFLGLAPFFNGDIRKITGKYPLEKLLREGLDELPASGEEVVIGKQFFGSKGKVLTGMAATLQEFTSVAKMYRILHLAQHGKADNLTGDYAFLSFAPATDGKGSELYAKDICNLNLNADLVVLSACETGIGELRRGEGIISLARAFAYAGAKSMMTTQWQVSDQSSAGLMRYFYRGIYQGLAKDGALRQAQLTYLADPSNSERFHPFFWAGYTPVGDMAPVR